VFEDTRATRAGRVCTATLRWGEGLLDRADLAVRAGICALSAAPKSAQSRVPWWVRRREGEKGADQGRAAFQPFLDAPGLLAYSVARSLHFARCSLRASAEIGDVGGMIGDDWGWCEVVVPAGRSG
jgi:hypothetical protein